MNKNLDSESMGQMQNEVFALVAAWEDRGVLPDEAAMILTANAHLILSKLGFSLGQVVTLMADGWKKTNGKL